MNKLFQNRPFLSFIITLILFCLCFFWYGWWSDSYQHMYNTSIGGEFTNRLSSAAHNPFPEYMPGGAYLFNLLGNIYPLPWVTIFLESIFFISIWVLYNNILKASDSYPFYSKLILVLFYGLLFLESIVLFHMVRITMFAGIAAISGVIALNANDPHRKVKYLLYLLLFIAALWIRDNVHLFLLIFVSFAFLLHRKSLKPLIPFWLVFSIAFLHYMTTVFYTDKSNDLNFFFLHSAEFKLHNVGEYKPDLILADALDLIKYKAIKHDILADEVNLSPAFYDKINIFSNISRFSLSHVGYAFMKFWGTVQNNLHFVLIDLLLMLFYILLGGDKIKHYRAKTVWLFLFFYLFVFAISFIKMEDRFLVPFQVLFLYIIIQFHKPSLFTKKEYRYLLLGFLIVSSVISFHFIDKKITFAKESTLANKQSYLWLKERFSNDIVIVNDGFVTMNQPQEIFYQKGFFKKFYIFNYFSIQLADSYRPYLEKECKCNIGTFDSFYDALLKENDRIVVLDNPDRIMVLLEYMQKVYGKKYIVKKIPFVESEYAFMGFGYKLEPFIFMKYQ